MATVRPPVPRRPIPLPTASTSDVTSDEDEPIPRPDALYARMAALSVAVSSADAKAKGFTLAKAPVLPRVPGRRLSSLTDVKPDMGRLLARKPPPPPPAKRTSTVPSGQLPNGTVKPPPPPPRRASFVISSTQQEVEEAVRPPPPPPRRASSFKPQLPVEVPEEESSQEPRPPLPPPRRISSFRQSPVIDEPERENYQEPPPPPPRRTSSFRPSPPVQEPDQEDDEKPVASPYPSRRRLPPPPDLSKPPPPPVINASSKPQRATTPAPALPTTYASCLKCRDFTAADTHATYFPREEVTTLADLAYNLTSPFEGSDVDKARVIFTWLHLNIAYNVADFFSGNIKGATPESTLRSGLAVCGGYAGLFRHLAELAGLEAHEVSGHGKGFGYTPLGSDEPLPAESSNHAWNCVFFEGEWHLIDPCWGAGAVSDTYTQRFDPTWFHSSAEEFGRRHFPTDRSFQLVEEPKTWEEYIAAPPSMLVPSTVLENGYDPFSVTPDSNTIPGRQYLQFKIAKLCEHMSVANDYPLLIHSDKENVPMVFNHEENTWTATFLTPPSGQVMIMFADTINGRDARGINVAQYVGRSSMTFKGLAAWSVEG